MSTGTYRDPNEKRTPLEMAKHIIECENSFDRFPIEAVIVAREVIKLYEKLSELEDKFSGGSVFFVKPGVKFDATSIGGLNIIKVEPEVDDE